MHTCLGWTDIAEAASAGSARELQQERLLPSSEEPRVTLQRFSKRAENPRSW
jgi:hypothetical protein